MQVATVETMVLPLSSDLTRAHRQEEEAIGVVGMRAFLGYPC
jgi:hypothetical protein